MTDTELKLKIAMDFLENSSDPDAKECLKIINGSSREGLKIFQRVNNQA